LIFASTNRRSNRGRKSEEGREEAKKLNKLEMMKIIHNVITKRLLIVLIIVAVTVV